MRHLFIIALLLLMGSAAMQAQERTVGQPAFDVRNTNTIEIDKIVLSDTATVLHIDAFYHPKYWIRIAKETTLEADGQRYPVQAADGLVLDEKFWMPESGTASFRLIFPPLPKGTKQVDLIEGDEKGAFKIWGIRLDGTRPEAALPVTETPRPAALEKPELKAGTGTLTGKFIGFRPGMDTEVSFLVFDPLTCGAEKQKLAIRPDGSFHLELPLICITQAYINGNNASFGCYLKPGGTTSVEINLPEICRQQSKKQGDAPSLGDKFRFTGALADLNNEKANRPADLLTLNPTTEEGYFQMIQDISTMTLDQFAAYWKEKYQAEQEKLQALTGISEAYRSVLGQILKDELVQKLLGYGMIDYAYRTINQIPRDSVLAGREQPVPSPDYFAFLPEFFSGDPYFLYDGHCVYTMQYIRYANFSGEVLQQRQDESYDNSADLARIMGTDEGFLFDLLAAQRLAALIHAMQPLDEEQLQRANAMDPVYRDALLALNGKLLQTLEANKKKSGYVVNRVNTADIPAEELFNAITTPYRGKVVFVDFWATWCGPCREAMKEAEPIKQEYEGKDVVFLYLATENSPKSTWEQMIPDIKGEHYRVTEAQWNYWERTFGVQGIPAYMVVGKDGTLVHFQTGFMGVDGMKALINKELEKE